MDGSLYTSFTNGLNDESFILWSYSVFKMERMSFRSLEIKIAINRVKSLYFVENKV